ncbi:hypothetical protein OEA41_002276 [Lepraria neglecta]|uniref:AB hydrolase-1 domain-containing protein n=1 Tax=Lepraria neglecta TaxID=209136 RepID=A0AAD9ZBB3_9LECA|nr:hypothetical protein OEA41_002276 [Lepraria neglecta]
MEMSSAHMVKDLEALRLHLGLAMMTLLGHSNGGSIALGYAERYPERVQKMILLDHQLEGFDDSTSFKGFAMRRKHIPVYSAALVRLQNFKADTDEEMHEGLMGVLPLYFVDPTGSLPLMKETMDDLPSSWAFNAQGTADRKMPTSLIDDCQSRLSIQTLVSRLRAIAKQSAVHVYIKLNGDNHDKYV